MTWPAPVLLLCIGILAGGTFAFRFAGAALRAKISVSPRVEQAMAVAAVVLLAAFVATSALTEAREFAGIARPAGVLVGGVLAWRKAPFVVVVLVAAAVAAGLRLLGVP